MESEEVQKLREDVNKLRTDLEDLEKRYLAKSAWEEALSRPGRRAPDLRIPLTPRAEAVRGAIAIYIVFVGIAVIIWAWYLRGVAEAESVAAILAGIIGIVMGYYFGRHGVDRAQTLAEEANKERRSLQIENEGIAAMKSQLAQYDQLVSDYLEVMEAMERDPVMRERLKEL